MARSGRSVEILGGGLAGLALGIGLRDRGIPVVVREAGRYPRHRVCGEFLAGLQPQVPERLGLDGVFDDARRAGTVAWFDRRGPFFRGRLPRPALCLSRHRLDARLAARFVAAGGELHTGARAPAEPAPGRVLACGRRPDVHSRLVGLKQHFRGLDTAADLEMHLGRGAYVGLTQVGHGVVNVCGLFRRGRGPLDLCGAVAAAGLTGLAARLASAEAVPGSACAVAALDYGTPPWGPGAVALGDRGRMIPPFTGHGMTMALESAALALPHLAAWACGRGGWEETAASVRASLDRGLRRRTAAARVLHPFLLAAAGQFVLRRLASLGLVPFGALCRLVH